MSSIENETLRFPTNLDRAAINQRLVHAREVAEKEGLAEVAKLLVDVEKHPPAQIAKAVFGALAWLENRPELRQFTLQLEMVALNLKNLK
jgi:hypothetical protein